MRKYADYVNRVHDNIKGREKVEWANYWYDFANKESNKRILLIGDSTVRMVRSTLSRIACCPVDMIGTSSGLHDSLFIAQMDAFFSSDMYLYDIIYIQLGHHSRVGDTGEEYNEDDYRIFKDDLNRLVSFLSQFTTKIVLLSVFYSVICYSGHDENWKPSFVQKTVHSLLLRCGIKKEIPDGNANRVKSRKNEIIKQIASERNVAFCDINQIMLDMRARHIDHIHFEGQYIGVIVREYMKYL